MLAFVVIPRGGLAQGGLEFVETANGNRSPKIRQLVRWTHARLVFTKDVVRLAVGQSNTMEVEILGGREALALAKNVGRTSIIAWYPDGTTETFLFSVVEDHSVLRRALRDIHPSIRIEQAPDRAALVLRGVVPTVKFKLAAEIAARNYLDSGTAALSGGPTVLVQKPADAKTPSTDNTDSQFKLESEQNPQLVRRSTATIINLIQVEQLPATTVVKVGEAIEDIGGAQVKVRRILRGDVEDDAADTLLLYGKVQNQVTLVRVLNVAARLFLGPGAASAATNAVEVVADESGALIAERENRGSGSFGGLGNLIGGDVATLTNDIKANIGRAKLLSVAQGRILSIIEVRDLPQVRVAVQIHEVDRRRLKDWRPDLTVVSEDYLINSISPGGSGLIVQPDASERVGALGDQLDNALQIVGGVLSNHIQAGTTSIAFDLLFSLMENEGISRTLSRPTLTVLAGEPAVFQVGGEVPVPSAFAPAAIGTVATDNVAATSGVFSGTEFKRFGVELRVRPMVGEDDRITLDVRPTISLPDTNLSEEIAGSTGTPLNTTAFNTRSLETTTRLRDGQPLVIGGLVSRNITEDQTYTPRVHKVPLLGSLTKSYDKGASDRELIIVVTPTIVREPMDNVGLWQFPTAYQLLSTALGKPDPATLPPELVPSGPADETDETDEER